MTQWVHIAKVAGAFVVVVTLQVCLVMLLDYLRVWVTYASVLLFLFSLLAKLASEPVSPTLLHHTTGLF